MNNEIKYTVKICDDYVITDPNKTKEILEKVSKIISNSYKRTSKPRHHWGDGVFFCLYTVKFICIAYKQTTN